jgi:hypothetical protein
MTITVQAERGCCPGSVYAGWGPEGRAASDRQEARFNHGEGLVRAEQVGTQPLRVADDDGLSSLARTYRRQLEDVLDDDLVGGEVRARLLRVRLADIQREQDARAALAASWLASEGGTHCYTAFVARGGLEAVAHHGSTPPSYQLAAQLDRLNYDQGQPYVLDWATSQPTRSKPRRQPKRS